MEAKYSKRRGGTRNVWTVNATPWPSYTPQIGPILIVLEAC